MSEDFNKVGVLKLLKQHLKTKEYKNYLGHKVFINSWSVQKQEGFMEAMALIRGLK
jgi:hypothetical protein